MTYLIVTLHRDYLELFDFLRDNPTRAYQKGDYYRLAYYLPPSHYLTPFQFGKLRLEVTGDLPHGWQQVRDYPTAYAGQQLLAELESLEAHKLMENRQGVGLSLTDWLLDAVCYGIRTKQETALLVRAMFVTGYDMEQVIGVFSTLARRLDLSSYFLQELARFYGEEVAA